MLGGLLAPDANSTLRVTYGQVKGVDTRDGLFYKPQTTLQGIVEKHTGSGDFDAPQRQLDAISALRAGRTTVFADKGVNDVPVNFLSTVDTTGGNSGSPTLNAKGELVGLLFDGRRSVSSDYLPTAKSDRSSDSTCCGLRPRLTAQRCRRGVADGARSGQGACEGDGAGQGPGGRAVAGPGES
jgi:hypothetical protein